MVLEGTVLDMDVVKLGDVLQTMIQEQVKLETEDQTSAIPDFSEIKTLSN